MKRKQGKDMAKDTSEKRIQNKILEVFGQSRYLRLWRQNVGTAVPLSVVARARRAAALKAYSDAGKILASARPVQYGINGAADLSGILPSGRRLEIEVKSATGRQSTDQGRYQRMIEKFGGVYCLARSVDDVTEAVAADMTPAIVEGETANAADAIAAAAIEYVRASRAYENGDGEPETENFFAAEQNIRRVVDGNIARVRKGIK